jgi:gp32 DNA binding protein like
MSTKYNASLFESLKEAFNNKTNTNSAFKDFLKFDTGKTYVVRLVPNTENINNSWYTYSQHIWKSSVTGKAVSVLCPNTYGEKCPIDEYRSKIWATKDKTLIDQTYPLRKQEKTLYNVYVISDPSNPSNEGQIKFLNAGSQLQKIIESALFGDDKDEFGSKVFDLSANGCSLRVKVEENEGGYPTYVSSRFLSPSKIDSLDTDDKINAVYDSFKPVDTVFAKKTYDEIKTLLDVHFLGKDTNTEVKSDVDDDYGIEETSSSDDEEVTDTKSDQQKRLEDVLKDL